MCSVVVVVVISTCKRGVLVIAVTLQNTAMRVDCRGYLTYNTAFWLLLSLQITALESGLSWLSDLQHSVLVITVITKYNNASGLSWLSD